MMLICICICELSTISEQTYSLNCHFYFFLYVKWHDYLNPFHITTDVPFISLSSQLSSKIYSSRLNF